MTDEEKTDWRIKAIKELGLPVCLLAVMIAGLWYGGSWTGNQIVLPLFNRQIQFIDSTDSAMRDMVSIARQASESQLVQAQSQREQTQSMGVIMREILANREILISGQKAAEEIGQKQLEALNGIKAKIN